MKKPIILFLTGQGFLCLGDTLFLTVSSLMVFKMTGSGVIAGLGMLCTFIPSVMISPISGLLGDIFNEKYMMVVTDLVRAVISSFFVFINEPLGFFLLIILSVAVDAVYGPPRRKFILRLVDRKDIIDMNSLMGCIAGVMFFIGPVTAGFIMENSGPGILYLSRSIIFLISATLTAMISKRSSGRQFEHKPASVFRINSRSIKSAFKKAAGFLDIRTKTGIAAVSLIVAGFTGLCSNMAFYWLAFDKLATNGKEWGLLLSIYFGSGALASLLLLSLKKLLPSDTMKTGLVMIPIFSAIWLFYGSISALSGYLLYSLIFVEGLSFTAFSICISTSLQVNTKTDCLSRVSGMVDFFSGIAKISAGIFSGLIMAFSPSFLFPVAAAINLIFLVFISFKLSCQRTQACVPYNKE